MQAHEPKIGAVAIGRNEGERLKLCLRSLVGRCAPVVYVDSGSTDGSADFARSLGVDVVELDMSMHFTAARARNHGWRRVVELAPDTDFIQFVDGDCEIVDGWLEAASWVLTNKPHVATVCGRRKERYPEASVYNRLMDIEWDQPPGEERHTFGGDVMTRVVALQDVGGYDSHVIGSEDDELLLRFRLAGWTNLRIARDSSYHDANIHSFKAWWLRAMRSGHAYGQVGEMYDDKPIQHYKRERRKAKVYGGALPALGAGLALPTLGLSLGAVGSVYALQFGKIYLWARGTGLSPRNSAAFALSQVIVKLPELIGLSIYRYRRLRNLPYTMIHYR
jgi:glycosyltransferase involved in cell wall biosynthesis